MGNELDGAEGRPRVASSSSDELRRRGISPQPSKDSGISSVLTRVIDAEVKIANIDEQIRALEAKKKPLEQRLSRDAKALEDLDDEKGQGRNFLNIAKDLDDSVGRQKAVQVGDYIRMPRPSGENIDPLHNAGLRKVTVVEVARNDAGTISRFVLEADGERFETHPSSFYNYGTELETQ